MDSTSPKSAIFNWSGGKDSALALYKTLDRKDISIKKLLTTYSEKLNRVSMHGLRKELLEDQLQALGFDGAEIHLENDIKLPDYNRIMTERFDQFKIEGIELSIYGDIFLEDLRKYREEQLAQSGIEAYFPLWKIETRKVVEEFIELGFKAITICVNDDILGKDFVGRIIDQQFLKDLPNTVDPAGENGEFHSFVFDGPIFKNPVQFEIGEKVYKKYELQKKKDDNCFEDQPPSQPGFWFCDLVKIKA